MVFIKFNYKFIGDEIEEADKKECESKKKHVSSSEIEEDKNQSNDTDDIDITDDEVDEEMQYSDDDILDDDESESDNSSPEMGGLENDIHAENTAEDEIEDNIAIQKEKSSNTTENTTVTKTYYLKNGAKLLVLDKYSLYSQPESSYPKQK